MKPFTIVDQHPQLVKLAEELLKWDRIAVDTESNSFYAYFEKVCLIQISTPDEDYIVDPLALETIDPLEAVFSDPGIEKIFHAASNDILGLKRDFRFQIRNLFDTSIACKLLGHKKLGLASVLESYFGVKVNKRWQRCNWSLRPLRKEQLHYARLDTHYLIPLRNKLAHELAKSRLLDNAKERFEQACEAKTQKKVFDPDNFIYVKGASSLDATGKRILKALYIYREKQAKKRNLAPFRIIANETLVRLARRRPESLQDLLCVKGLPRSYKNGRRAATLLKLLHVKEERGEEAQPDASRNNAGLQTNLGIV